MRASMLVIVRCPFRPGRRTSRQRAAQRSAAAVPHDARLGPAAARREVGGGHRGRARARRHDLRRSIAASRTRAPAAPRRRSSSTTPTASCSQAWGEGMFIFPHGATVDRDGNLWVTDARGENGKGHQVFKFSPDGKVLMTLGKAGVSGSGPDLFDQPTDVVVAPNGDIFVTDSHRNGKNNRVVQVHEGRQVHQGVGQERIGPRRVQRAAHDRDGFARPAVRRRSREQPHPDLRSGRHVPRRVAAVRPAERHLHHRATTRSTSPTRSRVPTPARTSCRASRRASASAAPRTAR